MKTILRIILILLVASVAAGAFTLAVNNNWIASDFGEGGQPPMMASSGQTTSQSTTRPEGGDHEGASLTQGLSGVLVTLLKLSGITILILMLQKGINLLGHRKTVSAQY